MCENLTSEVMRHKNCRRQLSDVTYPPCGFKKCDNNINGDNSNSNSNSNYKDNNNDDDNNGNTSNKHKNINNGNIQFCNSQ